MFEGECHREASPPLSEAEEALLQTGEEVMALQGVVMVQGVVMDLLLGQATVALTEVE